MRRNLLTATLAVFAAAFFMLPVYADTLQQKDSLPKQLFRSDSILDLVITGDIDAIWRDRGEEPAYHKITLKYAIPGQPPASFPARVRVRGHFRKMKNICYNPPLLLNIDKDTKTKGTLMAGQNKLKLVITCTSEELILREYLLYRVYNLLTPFSLRARLVKATFRGPDDKIKFLKPANPLTGFLLEPAEQAAKRNGMKMVEQNGLSPQFLMPSDYNLMAVFQYFASNTDWGVQHRHNIELVSPAPTLSPIPIAYDFDHSGMVDAPYAEPPEMLNLSSVKVRIYRGTCLPSLEPLEPVFELFRNRRKEIEALYQDFPGLSAGYRKFALRFIDQFYNVIDNPKRAEMVFLYPCSAEGSGNVIIKGLRKD